MVISNIKLGNGLIYHFNYCDMFLQRVIELIEITPGGTFIKSYSDNKDESCVFF
jgi:hypothetical protein